MSPELSLSDVPNAVAPLGALTDVPTGTAVNARLNLPLTPGTALVSTADVLVWDLGGLAAGAFGQ